LTVNALEKVPDSHWRSDAPDIAWLDLGLLARL
jgi:hypothetical protein